LYPYKHTSDEIVSDEIVSEEIATEEATVTDESTAAEDATIEEAVSDEVVTDEAASEETASDETPPASDEQPIVSPEDPTDNQTTEPPTEQPKPPEIISFNNQLQYPLGGTVGLQQVLQDIGITMLEELGRDLEINVRNFELIDFGTPGNYIIYVQVIENGLVLVQMAIVVTII